MEVYAEYGAIGVIVFLFIMMIVNLMKSQKAQNEDLDDIRVHIGKIEGKCNREGYIKNNSVRVVTYSSGVVKSKSIWNFSNIRGYRIL